MADYYDLCHRMFMAVPVRLFGIDQTIAEGAFFVAMQAAGFPHTVVVLSEGYGPIVHRLHLHLADTAYRVNQTNGGLLTGGYFKLLRSAVLHCAPAQLAAKDVGGTNSCAIGNGWFNARLNLERALRPGRIPKSPNL
jgi:hypothetical protein